jgi:hypothetical protein
VKGTVFFFSYLAIALTEMQISHTKLCALDMHWQEDFGSPRQVLNVAVATMFRASWDSARAFFTNLLFQRAGCGTCVHAFGLGGFGHVAVEVRVCRDEFGFARVPGFEDFSRGRTTKDYMVGCQVSSCVCWGGWREEEGLG